jgi:hypothetical protein
MPGFPSGAHLKGGQASAPVNRALDVALELGIPCGGWCPRGRKAEDGPIPDRYPLTETPSDGYAQRTKWNIRDADGTLILTWGKPTGGTLLALKTCRSAGKPHPVIDLTNEDKLAEAIHAARAWIAANLPGGVLNLAGPRASKHPGIYDRAREFFRALLGGRDG